MEEAQAKTTAAGFWDDPKVAEKFLKELSGVKYWVTSFDEVTSLYSDLEVLIDFAREDPSVEGGRCHQQWSSWRCV